MKYIASYDIEEHTNQQRSINLAAANVMEYISSIVAEIEPLVIISPCRTLARKGFFKAQKITIDNGSVLELPPTFGVSTKIGRIVSILWIQIWLAYQLLFKCKNGETIIVYHSVALIPIIKFVQRIKHFKLIFEIREIYSDINTNINKQKEMGYFRLAHGYIFATQLLNDNINTSSKPYLIAPGIYNDEKLDSVEKWNDDKIHLVYAGNFRRAKGGATASIKIAEFLDDRYVIHILGGGDIDSVDEITNLINMQNSKNGAKLIYEGLLRGKEFNRFLQKCDIGLSTQNPGGAFNDSSFPSKVLTYLSNGLEVISADIPAVTTSPIGDFIHYYKSYDSESIASAIKSIGPNKNSSNLLVSFHDNLKIQFKNLLTTIQHTK